VPVTFEVHGEAAYYHPSHAPTGVTLATPARPVDERIRRAALEKMPRSWDGAKLPQYDFAKTDLYDSGVARVDEAQVRARHAKERSRLPKSASIYEGYVPIEYLDEKLAEEDEKLFECADCGHLDEEAAFLKGRRFGPRTCPSCESTEVHEQEGGGYDWSEFSMRRGGFPVPEVHIDKTGKVELWDGNHRVHFWRENGVTHVPAWIIDERPKRMR
jgi:hypothetical protein